MEVEEGNGGVVVRYRAARLPLGGEITAVGIQNSRMRSSRGILRSLDPCWIDYGSLGELPRPQRRR